MSVIVASRAKLKFHDKLVNSNKKDADAYARKIDTARDNGTLDEPLNPPTLTLNTYLSTCRPSTTLSRIRNLAAPNDPVHTFRPSVAESMDLQAFFEQNLDKITQNQG